MHFPCHTAGNSLKFRIRQKHFRRFGVRAFSPDGTAGAKNGVFQSYAQAIAATSRPVTYSEYAGQLSIQKSVGHWMTISPRR